VEILEDKKRETNLVRDDVLGKKGDGGKGRDFSSTAGPAVKTFGSFLKKGGIDLTLEGRGGERLGRLLEKKERDPIQG